jgi:hypothetical protein
MMFVDVTGHVQELQDAFTNALAAASWWQSTEPLIPSWSSLRASSGGPP